MATSNRLHSAFSYYINLILTYCESNNVDVRGCLSSIAVGVCIGILIVFFLNVFPGQPLEIYNQIDENVMSTKTKPSSNRDIQELQSLCSLTKDQVDHVIQSMQPQQSKAVKRSKNVETGNSVSIFAITKIMILASLLSGLVYFLNRDYGNVVTFWFVKSFPRESATIGISLKNEL
eukprot:CCRYP_013860-RA/>CCRYP_013860-RA protein AED:0.01 eAED:0.01 QI:142/1/1/1/1/1/2/2579/175